MVPSLSTTPKIAVSGDGDNGFDLAFHNFLTIDVLERCILHFLNNFSINESDPVRLLLRRTAYARQWESFQGDMNALME